MRKARNERLPSWCNLHSFVPHCLFRIFFFVAFFYNFNYESDFRSFYNRHNEKEYLKRKSEVSSLFLEKEVYKDLETKGSHFV